MSIDSDGASRAEGVDTARTLTAAVVKDGEWFVARCLEVEVASQGETVDEALANLREALELFFEDAHRYHRSTPHGDGVSWVKLPGNYGTAYEGTTHMTQPPITAPTFDDTTDPQIMRTRVLTALLGAVLNEHDAHLRVRSPQFNVTPATAIAEILDQANAYWRVETAHGPYAVADYRAAAADMWTTGVERIPGVVAGAISAGRRDAGLYDDH